MAWHKSTFNQMVWGVYDHGTLSEDYLEGVIPTSKSREKHLCKKAVQADKEHFKTEETEKGEDV